MPNMLPGRLGDEAMSLATDPRAHSGQLRVLRELGLHELSYLTTDLSRASPLPEILDFVRGNEKSLENLYEKLDYHVEGEHDGSETLETVTEIIKGPEDNNAIKLHITRLATSRSRSDLPAIVYFHSGGMIIIDTLSRVHVTWAESLARTGFVVIAVDFRNAVGKDGGLHPFPAGLNDCAAAVRWVDSHREQLGVNRIVLQGDSGGGNLALATALKAKREGWLRAIDGVCAAMPYISNAYHLPREWKLRELPSLVECDGYLISSGTSSLNAKLYTASDVDERNPLAWPFWATEEDVKGLPPHYITVNELDPLRDEGIAYHRKLVKAGVRVVGKVNLGVVHEADMFLRNELPDLYLDSLWGIRKFADHLDGLSRV